MNTGHIHRGSLVKINYTQNEIVLLAISLSTTDSGSRFPAMKINT